MSRRRWKIEKSRRNKYRKKRQRKLTLFFTLILIVFMVVGIVYALFVKRESGSPDIEVEPSLVPSLVPKDTHPPIISDTQKLDKTKEPVSTEIPEDTKEPVSTEKPEDTKEPGEPEESAKPKGNKDKYVDNNYFTDAVFIGDSRTDGLFINTGLTEATFYAEQGLDVKTVFTKEFVKIKGESGKRYTVIDALKKNKFKKIYIMFGVNELGWIYEQTFIDKYKELIKEIKDIEKDSIIYIQSILPVTSEKSNSSIYTNKKISRYNKLLVDMSEEMNVEYLNVAEAISNKNGVLPTEGSRDGVHLTKPYYNKWLEYLKTHTAEEVAEDE